MLQRIAIFGGTFNPIHYGHIELALQVVNRLLLDQLIFMPTNLPPHKPSSDVSSKHRLEMCRIALTGHSKLFVSDLELRRVGISYTVDTLREVHEKWNVKDKIYFVLGSDMFLTIQNWKCPLKIFQLAFLCVVPRNGQNLCELYQHSLYLKKMGAETVILDIFVQPFSSTSIRNRIQLKKSVSEMLPEEVEKYIEENQLYRE